MTIVASPVPRPRPLPEGEGQQRERCLSRTTKARVLFIGILLLLAAFSWHPMGASLSGAFDKVLFDTAARLFAHPSTGQVALVNIDDRTLHDYGADGVAVRVGPLLQRLHEAASITLDDTRLTDADSADTAAAVRDNGSVIVPVSSPLAVDAAGRGQRHVAVGHYGVVTGFVPYLLKAQGGTSNVVLEAIRVAGIEHVGDHPHRHLRSYALSIAQARTEAVLVMFGHPSDIPQYAFADVVSDKVPADAFDRRMVFIGDALTEDGGFRISSLNMDAVSRAQLDALMTDAVISGNMVSELPGMLAIPIYLAIALGMVLICAYVPGRWMHLAALGWFAGMSLFPMVLLALLHRWLGLGLLPLVCVFIYSHFAWEGLRRTQNLLRREIDKLQAIASAVGMADVHPPMAGSLAQRGGDPVRALRQAMREIRDLQVTFVTLINQLPYPVFVVTNGEMSVWNRQASALLVAPDALPDMRRLIAQHGHGENSRSIEVTFGGQEHMLLYVPYASVDTSPQADRTQASASFLVCLVDIAGIKQSVMHDKQALRHIAHDLRSPLSTILQLIEERAEGPRTHAPQEHAFLDDLRRQADYSLRVAKDFLQLSRAEQIQRETFAPVALLDIATEAVDQLWPAAENKSIELIGPECELDDTLILANADMLIRALINVIDNALKYSSPATAITVRLVADGEARIGLHVIDQGIGITEENVPRLFDPFFQVEGKADGHMGVGLGLPFVKTVIERHGGSIIVSSKLGQGTDMHIALPRA
jgi:CHASE2 domain-containing sensor protein